MTNLLLDKKHSIQIPQNNNSFFEIKKNTKWQNSIIIQLNISEELNYINLFFIIKSFILNTEYPPYTICTSFIRNKREIITQKEQSSWFKNIDFYSFINWINFRLLNDSKYEPTDSFYGIIFIYSKDLIYLKEKEYVTENILEILKPIYPWTPEWLKFFQDQIEKIKLLEEELIYYKSIPKK